MLTLFLLPMQNLSRVHSLHHHCHFPSSYLCPNCLNFTLSNVLIQESSCGSSQSDGAFLPDWNIQKERWCHGTFSQVSFSVWVGRWTSHCIPCKCLFLQIFSAIFILLYWLPIYSEFHSWPDATLQIFDFGMWLCLWFKQVRLLHPEFQEPAGTSNGLAGSCRAANKPPAS